jgi:hypothetical protein
MRNPQEERIKRALIKGGFFSLSPGCAQSPYARILSYRASPPQERNRQKEQKVDLFLRSSPRPEKLQRPAVDHAVGFV